VSHRSLLADGPIGGFYPPTGILEVRGYPAPWETGRPNYSGQPAFGKPPDDVVEWLRYATVFDGAAFGDQVHMFVGRTGGNFNFRGYPERYQTNQVDQRRQLEHAPAEPLRLVMELSEGGAGYGDYVTIATSDPRVHEPQVRRVYKVLEHQDGRFFVSLLDVGSNGMDIPSSPGIYQNAYTRAMNPRLVKFPSWGLPEVFSGSAVFFGEAIGATPAAAGTSSPGVRADEEEDTTGITLDEVRSLQDTTIAITQGLGPEVRFVMVPLEGATVPKKQLAEGGTVLSGAIASAKAISPAAPQEVLIVSVSKEEHDEPSIFARGVNEGLVRIGDELFYFEDPAQSGGAGLGRGQLGNVAQPNAQAPQVELLARDPRDRAKYVNLPVQSSGRWEQEGFGRIRVTNAERRNFCEIFFHQSGFSQCLRGQFGTPIAGDNDGGFVQNVSRRLRLTGRGLLGTERKTQGIGASACFVPYLPVSPVTGPMTDEGIPVKKTDLFARGQGYVLIDTGVPGDAWEILAHLGPSGEGRLARPRDELGKGILRARFGTQIRPISNAAFAYDMPYRYPDRYEPEVESESLAYLQKSFRMPGAYWRRIEWVERPSRTLRERRCDVVVLARFDGQPEWDAKPTNEPGGLYLFDDENVKEGDVEGFAIDRLADQLEIRVYFRYPSGAFTRLPDRQTTDDWKETAILDRLTVEYEKAGVIVRHEEPPY